MYVYMIHIYLYICVCVCACMYDRANANHPAPPDPDHQNSKNGPFKRALFGRDSVLNKTVQPSTPFENLAVNPTPGAVRADANLTEKGFQSKKFDSMKFTTQHDPH